ncbi:hypothetical protein Esti_001000 [Eimeria stiedai]
MTFSIFLSIILREAVELGAVSSHAALLSVELPLLVEVEGAGDVSAVDDSPADVAVSELPAQERILPEAEEEEALNGKKEDEALKEDPDPKTEDIADLLLLERDLGGEFMNKRERLKAELNKLGYKSMWSLLSVVIGVLLLELVSRVYSMPIATEVQAAYRLRHPGRISPPRDLVPTVALMASPLAYFLAALLNLIVVGSISSLFWNWLSANFLKLDYEFDLYKQKLQQQAKEEEEELRSAAASGGASSSSEQSPTTGGAYD